jgi:hypothetical protein
MGLTFGWTSSSEASVSREPPVVLRPESVPPMTPRGPGDKKTPGVREHCPLEPPGVGMTCRPMA